MVTITERLLRISRAVVKPYGFECLQCVIEQVAGYVYCRLAAVRPGKLAGQRLFLLEEVLGQLAKAAGFYTSQLYVLME